MPAKKTGSDSAKAKQRPISAFFFQKATNTDSTANGNGQVQQQKTHQQSGKQQQQQQPRDDSPDVEVIEQPAKRARFFQSDEAAPPQQEEPIKPSPSAPNAQQPAHTEPAGSAPQHPPPRPGSHQRFQNKLVLGIGNRKAAGRDSIVPQKHTPLELQVVLLKKQHAGVLLAIEVSPMHMLSTTPCSQPLLNCLMQPGRRLATSSDSSGRTLRWHPG